MSKFKKGESGNPGGRPKGSKNKATENLRDVISGVLSKEMTPTKLKNILTKLEPKDRLSYMIKLADFVLPRLKQTDLNLEIDNLSEEQLTILIQKIIG
ncbi:DUF5681 domain-containing protein [Sunxiuqinia sp. A32]|uniref:DUF5681 domain-containing protein n=1 Tax=Sunxiuqinia sp. A32 TaxID=3461496 RepID=UPI004045B564